MTAAPQDAKGIFLAALDIADAAERAAFVDRSCGDDPALRQRVDELLLAYGQPEGPLDKLAAALAPTVLGQPIREQVGTSIGPYKLMEQIGEGGFGLVFVAEQQQPIRRKVALKIIKPGMDTRDVIARFEAERQALALMDHPNIARVLDAGTTESGRPYFVMELVRGVAITEYCDKHQLTPRERLELFVPVCNAIQHAHLKGIIHRDIKPSNVLVTLHDGKPVVKVIDFGVAKALHQSLTDRTIYTRFAQMIGTPLYMSPEQAEMSGLDIDTRTDVYSLGVLLYELLTGLTPFDKQRLAKAAYDEFLKIIREEDPPKPSLRLSQSSDSLPSIAALRKTEPTKLSKMFSGDLDWIAMKALDKDRTRRYETANAFAADVMRYLNDEPVEASPPSTAYRLRKFARKHRKPVIALAGIAAALALGAVVATWGLFRARQAEQAARASETKAIDALGQVTKERDAKETARIAESQQRDLAERQLANGLLRPIGFAAVPEKDPAELHSFVDWSAIQESPLKLRVLEIALENPETALRVARRAERVIQSCVGLSPIRRAAAIKLVSTKQRDATTDPRIRVAACWLALELGSSDLAAWSESCRYLSDPTNKSADQFGKFVGFAARRCDSQQISQLDLNPLLRVVEMPTEAIAPWAIPRRKGPGVQWSASNAIATLAPRLDQPSVECGADALISILEKPLASRTLWTPAVPAIIALAPRMEPAQITRACDALLAIPARWNAVDGGDSASQVLLALAPRLEPALVTRASDALLAILEKSKEVSDCESQVLLALAPRLEPAPVTRAGDALLAILEKSKDVSPCESQVLVALAPRLDPAQAKRAWDALLAILEKSNDDNACFPASQVLVALALRLEPAREKRAWDALLAILEKSSDYNARDAASIVLAALAPRLDPAQAKRAWDALLAFLEKELDDSKFGTAEAQGFVALAPRLEAAQVTRASDALLATLEKSNNGEFRRGMSDGLTALAPRLEPAQVARACDALLAILKKSRDDSPRFGASNDNNARFAASQVLVALAPRLKPAQAKRAWDVLLAILEKSNDPQFPYWASSQVLVALAPRLEAAQAKRACDALLAIQEKSKDLQFPYGASQVLVALAPRLEPAQVARASNALLAILEKSNNNKVRYTASEYLIALAPRFEPASRDIVARKATTSLLDDCAGFGPPQYYDQATPNLRGIRIAQLISSPRSLAKLLSHPACVGEQRESLLQRFDELVLHDGKPVFFDLESPDRNRLAPKQIPLRRFYNPHDAAAWIQQNWPDFDLETNCPVTWRGSR